MCVLLQAVRCDGSCLLAYGEQLVDVLKATLHLKCKEAADLAGNLLHHLLRALTLIYALDHRSTTMDWNKPLTEVLPIREWGVPGYLYNLQLKWHIPTKEEKEFTAEILETFLLPELARVRKHISQEEVMSRWVMRCISENTFNMFKSIFGISLLVHMQWAAQNLHHCRWQHQRGNPHVMTSQIK